MKADAAQQRASQQPLGPCFQSVGAETLTRIAGPPALRRAVSTSQAVRELGSAAQGNEVNGSLKSVWFAAPPSMALTLKIYSAVRSVEPWSLWIVFVYP